MNHVTLYALGQRILPDGLGGATADHNVVLIDDRIQNRWMHGATLAYHCDARSGYSLGDARSAYSGWRRQVLFLRPDLVVLIDDGRSVRARITTCASCCIRTGRAAPTGRY